MKQRLSRLICALILIGLALPAALGSGIGAAPVQAAADDLPEGVFVVRVYYRAAEEIRLLAGYDLFEYNNREEQYVLVAVDRVGFKKLQGLGFRVALDPAETANFTPARALPGQAEGIPGYACYRTVEETFATAEAIVAANPTLATWIDAGDSWERSVGQADGYDMRVLVLTNSAVAGPKPKFLVTASIHAREYAPAELITRFAEYLADNYGTDADATWLLDHHEIHLLLQTNPDGRKEAETGISWRKNTNENYCGATSSNRGADLNRNFSFYWNACAGCSSGVPCDPTYRGPTAASEPETQAVQSYLRAIFPDQRDAALAAAAPDDATGLYLDVHSYSELVLWPWGFTADAAPNGPALQTLGRKFAYFDSYTPQQAYQLYGTDGTTDDFAYGELGVAAYTFELGTAFFQDCTTFENTIVPAHLPALIYAAKVARTPYLTPAGPDALAVTVSPAAVTAGGRATLTAALDDTRYNTTNGAEPTQAIAAAEYYIDTPPWQTGAVAAPLAATDGGFNSSIENVTAVLETGCLSAGRHILYVRGRDAEGAWGAFSATFLTVEAPAAPDYTLCVTPAAQVVCAPAAARYEVAVRAWNGFSGPVTLNAGGAPAGVTASFSPNPVAAPGASTLTLNDTAAAAAGAYTLAVSGAAASGAHTAAAQMTLYAGAPAPAALSAPADGSTSVATTTAFAWAAPGAASYEIQVATDPAFTALVASAAGLTAPGFTPASALALDTVYYWRVRAGNPCGAAWSAVAAFRTAADGCTTYTSADVPRSIQDKQSVGSTLAVPDAFTLTDVDATIGRIDHTYDADLDIYLRHPDATEIMLSTDNGGSGDNYVDTTFDDEAAAVITAGAAPFTGRYRPEGLLRGFDGKAAAGTWTLRIYDDGAGDTGTLSAWRLTLCGDAASVAADYSDLAASYGIAWHTGGGAVRLGALWDADAAFWAGYDDGRSDDGATRGAWTATTGTVNLTVTGAPGYVIGWFDWNEDGDFADDGEQAFTAEPVGAGESRSVSFATGTSVYGKTITARFRVASAADASPQPDGAAADGEDEDYTWHFSPSAVTLASLTAAGAGPEGVLVAWETVSETNSAGFNLYRADGGVLTLAEDSAGWTRLNAALIPSAAPGSGAGHAYTWLDATAMPNANYVYRLDAVALDGTVEVLGRVDVAYRPPQRRWLPFAQR